MANGRLALLDSFPEVEDPDPLAFTETIAIARVPVSRTPVRPGRVGRVRHGRHRRRTWLVAWWGSAGGTDAGWRRVLTAVLCAGAVLTVAVALDLLPRGASRPELIPPPVFATPPPRVSATTPSPAHTTSAPPVPVPQVQRPKLTPHAVARPVPAVAVAPMVAFTPAPVPHAAPHRRTAPPRVSVHPRRPHAAAARSGPVPASLRGGPVSSTPSRAPAHALAPTPVRATTRAPARTTAPTPVLVAAPPAPPKILPTTRTTPRTTARTTPSTTKPTPRPTTTTAPRPAPKPAPKTTVRPTPTPTPVGCAPVRTLANTRPWVSRAGRIIAARFGVPDSRILGRAARGTAGSDHPTGLALDFLVNTATGNQLADYVLANRVRFGVTYVIWRQRINFGSGWRPMPDRGSPTANHLDHVHVSFKSSGC